MLLAFPRDEVFERAVYRLDQALCIRQRHGNRRLSKERLESIVKSGGCRRNENAKIAAFLRRHSQRASAKSTAGTRDLNGDWSIRSCDRVSQPRPCKRLAALCPEKGPSLRADDKSAS